MNSANSEHLRVQLLAYTLWQKRGSPLGSPNADWFTAEEILGIRQLKPTLPLFAFGIERWTG